MTIHSCVRDGTRADDPAHEKPAHEKYVGAPSVTPPVDRDCATTGPR